MKYWLIITFFLLCRQSHAQVPEYFVNLVTGKAAITKPGSGPVAIKQKDTVYKNDKIVLEKGTELTLVNKSGNYLVLNAAGTYRNSDLAKMDIIKNEGITKRFLELAFHELLDPHHDFEKFKKENAAGVSGGVFRGDECRNRIFPVNGLKTSATSIVF